jgi:hypothetical protein
VEMEVEGHAGIDLRGGNGRKLQVLCLCDQHEMSLSWLMQPKAFCCLSEMARYSSIIVSYKAVRISQLLWVAQR